MTGDPLICPIDAKRMSWLIWRAIGLPTRSGLLLNREKSLVHIERESDMYNRSFELLTHQQQLKNGSRIQRQYTHLQTSILCHSILVQIDLNQIR